MNSVPASAITVPVLTAPPLRLRPFSREDASWVYYVSLDAELRDRLSLPEPYTRADARYFVDRVALAAAREGRGADFAIEDLETETAMGWVGFHRREDGGYECGYWLALDLRGHGIMTTALRVACRWALEPSPDGLGATVIHWAAHVGNYASRIVAEKVGFVIDTQTVRGTRGPKWSGHLTAGSRPPSP